MTDSLEIWKPVLEFEGRYEVSNMGNVRGIKKGKLLSPTLRFGYPRVSLLLPNGKKKNAVVHRLVLEAFIGKSDLTTDHINSIKTDNRLENLEYVSIRENQHRKCSKVNDFVGTYFNKLNNKWKVQICVLNKRIWLGQYDTREEARKVYREAFEKYETLVHGECQ